MTRLEVILVDCQAIIGESSELGSGGLTLNFHAAHIWHDSAHGLMNVKSEFFQNGKFHTSYVDDCFECY